MSNHYEIIDEKRWKRAIHCEMFRNSIEPAFCITVELDITGFLQKIKAQGYSFTMAMIYIVTKCANDLEEFRYRFINGKVVLFDRIDTSFTYLNKETELFKVINVPMKDSMEEYITIALKAAEMQKDYITGQRGEDIFQFSPIPWISYLHISHTNSGRKENAIPLFDWGKFYKKNEKMLLPFSVQAHHSFVDGIHVGKLIDSIQKYLYMY